MFEFNSFFLIFKLQSLKAVKSNPDVDDFMPIFVYNLLKAYPPSLYSNIQYISHFRNPNFLNTESGYYFISFLSAVSFIENLEPKFLNMNSEEFSNLYQKYNSAIPIFFVENPLLIKKTDHLTTQEMKKIILETKRLIPFESLILGLTKELE